MKRFMIILSLVFSMLFLGFSFSEASPKKRCLVSQVETEVLEKKIPYLKSQLNIPVVKIPGNNELANKINKGFKEEALSFRNQVELEAKRAYEELTKAGVQVSPYEAKSLFEVHNLKDYLSLTITYYQYTGGAHGISQVISHNYDLVSGNRLELKDIFKEGYNYQEVINKFIKEAIAQKPEEYFPDAFQGITENQNFYIGREGITIYFQNYEIAPYAAGNPEFLIPYSIIREGLNINIQ
ncbi:DUF3298 and DUF4163 domain-containing protein [Alloiococcus sp. CFN-8]|uniref:DUF3298 and DUF4163 domain-containing protein n=1 Tax=Alloiococcus sp. CFN-8 TaxID=3416081 RepID=UPI003CF3AC2D